MTPKCATSSHSSGLIPATFLGLLGLPLIVEAGASSNLPLAAYQTGLVLALGLGLTTALRTSRIERYAALVATVLLGGLCLAQITIFRPSADTASGLSRTRETGQMDKSFNAPQSNSKNDPNTTRKTDEE